MSPQTTDRPGSPDRLAQRCQVRAMGPAYAIYSIPLLQGSDAQPKSSRRSGERRRSRLLLSTAVAGKLCQGTTRLEASPRRPRDRREPAKRRARARLRPSDFGEVSRQRFARRRTRVASPLRHLVVAGRSCQAQLVCASAEALAEAEASRRSGARGRVQGSSAFAKARADIAEASAEACRGAKPLG